MLLFRRLKHVHLREGPSLNINAIKKTYRRYAQVYDFYFGAVFHPGRKAVIEKLNCKPGDQILEVGVGTGLSLPIYPAFVHVTGIDISDEMLARAKVRKLRKGMQNVTLEVMDAENMRFADSSFDKVVAMYVASVVPHPELLLQEMQRVCKPDGELFIVNHFHHSNPIIGTMERFLAPLSKIVGFRPDFCLDTFLSQTGLDVIEKNSVNMFGYWTLLRARNSKAVVIDEAPRSKATA